MKKLGRNTTCPCGSGKKVKRCCAWVLQPSFRAARREHRAQEAVRYVWLRNGALLAGDKGIAVFRTEQAAHEWAKRSLPTTKELVMGALRSEKWAHFKRRYRYEEL